MEFSNHKAIYLQIADQILERILSNEFNAGDRIHSVRELAANISVNPNTVARTYNYLQDQDIIFNKRGIGYFVGEKALQKAKDMKRQNFIENILPEVFKMMILLDISFDDLKTIYQKQKENNHENE